MNRKGNPYLALIALLLLLVLIVSICTGCSDTAEAEETDSGRFTMERVYDDAWRDLYIVTDKEMGVQYLLYTGRNGSGLTKLEQAPESEKEAKE